ncbi:hypothetical protein [Pseudooceanicola sp. LIPI14-2-Ac024]|uniref:hypothetical protein n=1 Tax=Pseudooceanicola sp. LIPI14-2-Ac024 TaxID=3344875 RepID=UPI0035D0854B
MGEWCHRDRGEPVAALGLKPAELSVLAVLRHYCAGFAVPERHGWIAAISTALTAFGEDRGPEVAVAALGVIQSVRRLRRSSFVFNSADCATCAAYVTGHERLVLSALRAVARGQDTAAHAYATLLCEGADAAPVVRALGVLIDRAFEADDAVVAPCPAGARDRAGPTRH